MNHGLNPKYVYTQIIPFYTLGQLLIDLDLADVIFYFMGYVSDNK